MLVVHTKDGRSLVITAVIDRIESIYSVRYGFVEQSGDVVVLSYRVRKDVEAAVLAGRRKYTAKEWKYGRSLSERVVLAHAQRVHAGYSVYT